MEFLSAPHFLAVLSYDRGGFCYNSDDYYARPQMFGGAILAHFVVSRCPETPTESIHLFVKTKSGCAMQPRPYRLQAVNARPWSLMGSARHRVAQGTTLRLSTSPPIRAWKDGA
jgi:hypothetical protein